jgi:hypothetical protein
MVLAKVDRERAVALAADSEQAVGEAERDERDEALAVVARALAAVEQWDRAEQAVRTITDADTQAKALGDLAGRSPTPGYGTGPSGSPAPYPTSKRRSERWPRWPGPWPRSTRTARWP